MIDLHFNLVKLAAASMRKFTLFYRVEYLYRSASAHGPRRFEAQDQITEHSNFWNEVENSTAVLLRCEYWMIFGTLIDERSKGSHCSEIGIRLQHRP